MSLAVKPSRRKWQSNSALPKLYFNRDENDEEKENVGVADQKDNPKSKEL